MINLSIDTFSYEASNNVQIKNIHTTFEEGNCIVLTGKSGCGKSTLLRLINRLIPTFYKGTLSGNIIINQKNINEYTNDELVATIGCVFQNPNSQFINVDTENEIAFGCENLGLSREEIKRRVMGVSELLGINHLLDKSIFSLSGGEKQIIAIASIYAMGVDVFLMDEPSANLDEKSTKQLEHVINILKENGKTIIVAEHRLHYLRDLADRLIILDKGEIVHQIHGETIKNLTTKELHDKGLRAMVLEKRMPYGTTASANTSILVENLDIGYKNHPPVIEDFYECFASSMINGIVGHNGRGKTTFAKCLCGMLNESSGTISINGKPYARKKRLGKIYMVLQNTTSQLFADSVIGELALAKRTSKEDCGYNHDQVLEMLDLLHLKERHPMSLSGGEKQRLAIAVGIVQNAEAMVLDEPTSGLDYSNMLMVKKILKMLKDKGKYVIIITHDHEFLTTVCDRVIEL